MSKKKSNSNKLSGKWKYLKGTEPTLSPDEWNKSHTEYIIAKYCLFFAIPLGLLSMLTENFLNGLSGVIGKIPFLLIVLIPSLFFLGSCLYFTFIPQLAGYYQCKCCGYRFTVKQTKKFKCPHCKTDILSETFDDKNISDGTKPKLSDVEWKKMLSFKRLWLRIMFIVPFIFIIMVNPFLSHIAMFAFASTLFALTLPISLAEKMAGYYECKHCGYRFNGLKSKCPNCEKSIENDN